MLIKDLSFSFGSKKIFSEVNMSFPKGVVTGIVGKNGVGKTTFFRTIKGIYKPRSGRVMLDDLAVHKKDIGFLPTDPFFYPYMKGQEYLELVMVGQKSFDGLADLFELPLQELVQNYSTGMKKKLAFAGIMGLQKKILILDEPFNGVDIQSNIILRRLIRTDIDEKVTIVSSHVLESMLELCDQIYFIDEGFHYKLYDKTEFHLLEQVLAVQMDDKISAYKRESEG